jgi:chromosome segregation ATPase
MQERLQTRLTALKNEFEQGQKMAADLEARLANLRATCLRIAGAIQVLEEELAPPRDSTTPSSVTDMAA